MEAWPFQIFQYKYVRSAFMTRIVDWFPNEKSKQWVKLEEDATAMKLKSLPWVAIGSRLSMREMPFLVSSTLKVWDVLLRKSLGLHGLDLYDTFILKS